MLQHCVQIFVWNFTQLFNINVFLWQLFPDGLQRDFQLIRVRPEIMARFQHGTLNVIVGGFNSVGFQ